MLFVNYCFCLSTNSTRVLTFAYSDDSINGIDLNVRTTSRTTPWGRFANDTNAIRTVTQGRSWVVTTWHDGFIGALFIADGASDGHQYTQLKLQVLVLVAHAPSIVARSTHPKNFAHANCMPSCSVDKIHICVTQLS